MRAQGRQGGHQGKPSSRGCGEGLRGAGGEAPGSGDSRPGARECPPLGTRRRGGGNETGGTGEWRRPRRCPPGRLVTLLARFWGNNRQGCFETGTQVSRARRCWAGRRAGGQGEKVSEMKLAEGTAVAGSSKRLPRYPSAGHGREPRAGRHPRRAAAHRPGSQCLSREGPPACISSWDG